MVSETCMLDCWRNQPISLRTASTNVIAIFNSYNSTISERRNQAGMELGRERLRSKFLRR
jgi:hypothetical protein